MSLPRSQFESAALAVALRSVVDLAEELDQVGLTPGPVELHQRDHSTGMKASEIEICFYRDKELVDVLEFFVWKNEGPTATLPEIKEWLKDSIRDVAARQKPS